MHVRALNLSTDKQEILMKRLIIASALSITAISAWAAVTSPVGYVTQKEPNLTARGGIVSLPPGQISPVGPAPQEVVLKYHDAILTSHISIEIAGTRIDTQWVPPEAKVDQVLIGDDELTLLKDRFENGRLITEEYGEIPVYFYLPGMISNSSDTNICILVFDEDQLQKLRAEEQRKQLAEESPQEQD